MEKSKKSWIIYGAYGYTGELLAKEALSRGYKPILSGRSKEKLLPLANKLNLEALVLNLKDDKLLQDSLQGIDLILNAAGPFKYTSEPIVKTCLKTGTNYLDITGEIPVFEQNFKYHEEAKTQEIAIMSGVGFDVVPTDCMAKYVSEKVSNPIELEIGIVGFGSPSRGTLKTMVEYLTNGRQIRRNGELIKNTKIKGPLSVQFFDKERTLVPVSWGDLSTGYRTTGIPNITTYMPYSKPMASMIKGNKTKNNIKWKNNIDGLRDWIDKNVHNPDEEARMKGRSYIWAQARNAKGDKKESWLDTMEGYRFTSISGIKAVEKIFELKPKGSLTPALAFGEDFILEFPDTKRYDSIEK
jgi:short subunit dehydrogenase-like uncharacterized protein